MTIKDINLDAVEGQVLLMAIGRLMCAPGYTGMTPDQILDDLYRKARTVDGGPF